jgi:membrane-associated phospholipid phosphatase
MTRLTRAEIPERPSVPASPQRARKTWDSSPMRWLTDTRVRLGLGTVAVLVTALSARRDRVGHGEAQTFRAVNSLPDSLYGPVWVIMQLGALGAVPAAAVAALLAHDRELGGRLLAGGVGTWALSKLVKQTVRRPRPAALVSGARTRGRDASGLGYLSGHAGVAVALGAAALPRLSPSGRAVVAAAMPIVGLSRIYVGAHLPLDVAGGVGLGLAVEAAAAMVWHPGGNKNRPDVRCLAPKRLSRGSARSPA